MVSFLVSVFSAVQEIAMFVFIFVLLYALFNATEAISKNKKVNIIVALSISLLVTILNYYYNIILNFTQFIAWFFIMAFIALMLGGLTGFDFKSIKSNWASVVIVFLVLMIFLFVIGVNVFSYVNLYISSVITLLVFFGIIYYVVQGGESGAVIKIEKLKQAVEQPTVKKKLSPDEKKRKAQELANEFQEKFQKLEEE